MRQFARHLRGAAAACARANRPAASAPSIAIVRRAASTKPAAVAAPGREQLHRLLDLVKYQYRCGGVAVTELFTHPWRSHIHVQYSE